MPVRVLIVDDHPSFRAIARALLVAEGFDVVGEAADGQQAIRAVECLAPDAVLLDIQLPDTDGFEVARRIVGNGSGPVVVLTSSRDAAEFGGLIAASGAAGFVPKGEITGDTLRGLIR